MRLLLMLSLSLPLTGCLGLMAEDGRRSEQVVQAEQFVETTKRSFIDCLHKKTPSYASTGDTAADVGVAVLGACHVQGNAWKQAVYSLCRANGNEGLWRNDPRVDVVCTDAVTEFEPKLKDLATSLVVSYRASH